MGDLLKWDGTGVPSEPWHVIECALRTRLDLFWRDGALVSPVTETRPNRIAGSKWDQPTPAGVVNPYWEIIRHMPSNPTTDKYPSFYGPGYSPSELALGRDHLHWFGIERLLLCSMFTWAIPTPGDMAWMRQHLDGRGLVELGAGGGYWLWQLQQHGIDAIGYDIAPWRNGWVCQGWAEVAFGDHEALRDHSDRALFLCWPPPYSPMPAMALKAWRGDLLFFCGMPTPDISGDDEFYQLIEDDDEWEELGSSPFHVGWDGFREWLTVYRRRGSDA